MGVEINEAIDAPAEAIWALIGNFSKPQQWHPLIVATDVNGEGVGAVRTVRYEDSWIQEQLDGFDPAAFTFSYSVRASGLPGPDITGLLTTMTLTPLTPASTSLRWEVDRQPPLSEEAKQGLATYLGARVEHLRHALNQDR